MKTLKTSYGDTAKLTSREAAYIAGLIDADGTVTLGRHNNSEHRRPEVSIANTDLNMLQWVKKTIGAGQIKLKRPQKKNHQAGYTYIVSNRQAFNFLVQIASYLKTYKQKRTKLILEKYPKVTLRNGKYSDKLQLKKQKFTEEFFAIPKI